MHTMLSIEQYVPLNNITLLMQRGFDKRFCEEFQAELSYDKIDSIWKNFREAGNSIEGRIVKLVLMGECRTLRKL